MTLICTLTQIKPTNKIQQMCQIIKKPTNSGGVQKFHEKRENNDMKCFIFTENWKDGRNFYCDGVE